MNNEWADALTKYQRRMNTDEIPSQFLDVTQKKKDGKTEVTFTLWRIKQ